MDTTPETPETLVPVAIEPATPADNGWDAISGATLDLVTQQPFWGAISMRVPKGADHKCDTAYVTIDQKGNPRLGFNPTWMRKFPKAHQIGILKHEFMHLILLHCSERRTADPKLAKLWNIATDLAINSLIGKDDIPAELLFPGRRPKVKGNDPGTLALADLIESFPVAESSDWYMSKLEEVAKQHGQGGSGDGDITIDLEGQFDDHGGWGNVPDEIKDLAREQIKELVRQGSIRAQESGGWGNVPESLLAYIQAMLSSEVDWKSILRNFVGSVRSVERESTMKRINKKAPHRLPGAKRTTMANILFAVDQSGSVSDEDVAEGLAEAVSASRMGQIDVINFDTEVDEASLQTVRNGSGMRWKRTRCGGTDFNCVQRYLNGTKRGKYSAVIIFTDGYADKMGAIVGARVMWLITKTGDASNNRPGDLVVKMSEPKQLKRI